MHEKLDHRGESESYMKRWIIHERSIIHEKVNRSGKKWILQEKAKPTEKGESYRKRWIVHEKVGGESES